MWFLVNFTMLILKTKESSPYYSPLFSQPGWRGGGIRRLTGSAATTTTPPVSGPHPPPTSQPPPNLEKVHQAQALESLLREIEQRVSKVVLLGFELKLIVLHFLFVFDDRENTQNILKRQKSLCCYFNTCLSQSFTLGYH